MSIFRFMDLPRELRDTVYEFALSLPKNRITDTHGHSTYKILPAWLRLNKEIREEALCVFRRNIFVAVTTPWHRAYENVSSHGFVPLLATDEAGQNWKHYHLEIQITSPRFPEAGGGDGVETDKFIILLDDLEIFCDFWGYQDLAYPGLNSNLHVKCLLRDPYNSAWDNRPIPKALQKRLIEPFGVVRGLGRLEVEGQCYESIEKAMRQRTEEKIKTPEECLEEAEKLKEEGNELLKKKLYHEALRKYEASFFAIHIIISGQRRSVFADAYFDIQLRSGPNAGQPGHLARIMLRLKLVANTIMAYLSLEDWEMARFWGIRTITLLYGTSPDDPLLRPAKKEIGKIYFRTGKACRELKDKQEALRYLDIAEKYLPGDKSTIDTEVKAARALG